LQTFTWQSDIVWIARQSNEWKAGSLNRIRRKSKAPLHSFRGEVPMSYLRSCLSPLSPSVFSKPHKSAVFLATLLSALSCIAQDQPQSGSGQQAQITQIQKDTVTIPAGTRFALVLTHPIQSRYIHRGDDIYAQVTSPVDSGNQVVVPPGTFVQGTVDKLEQKGGRAFLHLQSMAITFPDGYVAPVSGPITLDSNEGYAIKDPGGRRVTSSLLLPAAGAGLGALIGHSVGTSQDTITSTLPPGCVGPPPGCLSSSLTVPGNQGMHTAIGAGVGAAVGMIASMAVIFSSRHFFMDVGSPVELTLEHPMTLQQDEVVKAVKHAEEHPVAEQAVASRPVVVPPTMPADHGTCYTPETPGTPPTVIPGAPGADGVPGPPTVIPGTPPAPGTPYPCP
jgi:hypothetical protein